MSHRPRTLAAASVLVAVAAGAAFLPPTGTGLSVLDAEIGQGNEPITFMRFTLERDGDLSFPLVVSYQAATDATAAHPAIPGVDFEAIGGGAAFPVGESTASVDVPILRVGASQPQRGMRLTIADPLRQADFYPRLDFAMGFAPNAVVAVDLDSDGLPELAAAKNGEGALGFLENDAVSPQQLSYSQEFGYIVGTGPNILDVAAADLDGDLRPDMIATDASENAIGILRNATAGAAFPISFDALQSLPANDRPASLAVADLDGDGRADLVAGEAVASGGRSQILLFRNLTGAPGAIAFAPAQTFEAGNIVNDVAAVDLNGDGRPDLVAALQQDDALAVRINASAPGSIALRALQTFATGATPRAVVGAQLDDDGRPDLAVARGTSLLLLPNTTAPAATAAAFGVPQPLTVGAGALALAAGDFDDDGRIDLVVGGGTLLANGEADLTVLLNRTPAGSQTYGFEPITLRVGGLPSGIAVGDFNVDGRADFATANGGADSVSVVAGTGPISLVRATGKGTLLRTPSQFSIPAVTDAEPGTAVVSAAVTMPDLPYAAEVNATGGDYRIDEGPFTNDYARLSPQNRVQVRLIAADTPSTTRTATLTIGGISADFSVTTRAAPAVVPGGDADEGGGGGALSLLTLMLLGIPTLRRRNSASP